MIHGEAPIARPREATSHGAAEPVGAPPRGRGALFLLPAALLLGFVALPLVALLYRATTVESLLDSLRSPVVRDALRLSALTTAVTLLVALVTGTPLAFLLARRSFRGKRAVETLVDLPLILPPVVAGLALLMAFGRRGLLGEELRLLGLELPFTTAAVVLAQLFVAAPFYVRSAKVGFQGVPRDIEEAALVDGATPWAALRDVTLPLALPGIGGGAVLCWARALSEFGATLLFAGNFQGRTQTMPLAIMGAFERDLGEALALSVLLLALSAAVLAAARLLARDVER